MADDAAPEEPVILTEVVDRIGIITLNRPERRNALNPELMLALHEAVGEMASDPQVKVVILTGAAPEGGLGGFCAGGDVKGSSRGGPGSEKGVPRNALTGDLARHDEHASMLLHQMPKPTIAMIGGAAVGAGLSLAGACDLRFASTDAVFAANFMPNGLAADYGGTLFWTRIVGTARARQLFLMNDKVTAEQALAWGMVHEVLPPEQLRERTMEVARRLVRTPAELMALVKDNLNQAEDEIGRRRFLLANEAHNQGEASRLIAARIAAKQAHEQAQQ